MFFGRKLLFCVVITLALTIAATISLANDGQPANAAQLELLLDSESCALPCFLGIIPGETTYVEAISLVRATVPKDQFVDAVDFWLENESGTRIHVKLNRNPLAGDYIESIELSTWGEGQIVSVGDLLDTGYAPVKVFRNRINGPNAINLLVVFGDDMQIAANVVGIQKLDQNSPIETMTLFAHQDRKFLLTDLRTIRNFDYEISWLGFTSVENYLYA